MEKYFILITVGGTNYANLLDCHLHFIVYILLALISLQYHSICFTFIMYNAINLFKKKMLCQKEKLVTRVS